MTESEVADAKEGMVNGTLGKSLRIATENIYPNCKSKLVCFPLPTTEILSNLLSRQSPFKKCRRRSDVLYVEMWNKPLKLSRTRTNRPQSSLLKFGQLMEISSVVLCPSEMANGC